MQFATWEPIYQSILQDFGFSPARDEEAAKLLAELLMRPESHRLPAAKALVRGRRVVVFGNAPSLEAEICGLQERDAVFFAADGATAVLLRHGIVPDIVVTDLDGPFPAILKANREGLMVVVHAHGDNLDALNRYVPQLQRIIGTVQCRPPPGLYNFGGFTDGDRCVFLARELGAASIKLVGFDFEDESVTPRKRKKLAWARRLIELALAISDLIETSIQRPHLLRSLRIALMASSATSSASCSASISTNLSGSRAAMRRKFSSTDCRNSSLSNFSRPCRDCILCRAACGSRTKSSVLSGRKFQGR